MCRLACALARHPPFLSHTSCHSCLLMFHPPSSLPPCTHNHALAQPTPPRKKCIFATASATPWLAPVSRNTWQQAYASFAWRFGAPPSATVPTWRLAMQDHFGSNGACQCQEAPADWVWCTRGAQLSCCLTFYLILQRPLPWKVWEQLYTYCPVPTLATLAPSPRLRTFGSVSLPSAEPRALPPPAFGAPALRPCIALLHSPECNDDLAKMAVACTPSWHSFEMPSSCYAQANNSVIDSSNTCKLSLFVPSVVSASAATSPCPPTASETCSPWAQSTTQLCFTAPTSLLPPLCRKPFGTAFLILASFDNWMRQTLHGCFCRGSHVSIQPHMLANITH